MVHPWEAYEVDWPAIGDFMKCLRITGATACRLATKCMNARDVLALDGGLHASHDGPGVYVPDCAISSF